MAGLLDPMKGDGTWVENRPSFWDKLAATWGILGQPKVDAIKGLMDADLNTLLYDTGPAAQRAVENSFDSAGLVTASGAVTPKPKNAINMGMRVFRGTPELEPTPEAKDFGSVFVSKSKNTASQYGPHVTEYELPDDAKLLDMNDVTPDGMAARLMRGYLAGAKEEIPMDQHALDEWAAELHMLNNYEDWPSFLKGFGYQGSMFGEDIRVLDPKLLTRKGAGK